MSLIRFILELADCLLAGIINNNYINNNITDSYIIISNNVDYISDPPGLSPECP